MFTSSEFMHSALQALGVDKKGDVFRATKKLGYNKSTSKSYTYYEIERDGKTLRTDQADTQPPKPKEQAELSMPESSKDLQLQPSLKEVHKQAYEAVMDNIMGYVEGWCPLTFDEAEGGGREERMLKLILAFQPHIGSQVNTLVIRNGNKR